MAIEVAIQGALYGHLKTMDLPTALPIAPEGKNFDAKGKAYLRPTFLPADTAAFGTEDDGDNLYSGLFQIDVFWPVNRDIAEPLAVAAALAARFCRGSKISAGDFIVRIDQPASVLPSLQEPNWFQIPVRARWAVYAASPVAA